VGKQSVLWDVAGFIVEWDLDRERRDNWLASLAKAGLTFDPERLSAYELAYATFKLGQTVFCLDLEAPDSSDHPRLTSAQGELRRRISSILDRF
jgi:hypothetical protein